MLDGMKLFLVEFGKPSVGNVVYYGNKQDSLFVIAKGYDDAEQKALRHIELKMEGEKSKSILDYDGSLRLNEDSEIQVSVVKIVSNEIVI